MLNERHSVDRSPSGISHRVAPEPDVNARSRPLGSESPMIGETVLFKMCFYVELRLLMYLWWFKLIFYLNCGYGVFRWIRSSIVGFCPLTLVAIYPIFIAVGLRQDCNKILLHFHYIWVSVGLRWDCKKKDYISITFSLRFYYIYITSLQSKCNKNVM